MKRLLIFCLALLIGGFVYAAEDKRVDITGFESADEGAMALTGSTIVESWVVETATEKIPDHEGKYSLYGSYDTSLGTWNQTTLTFANPVDFTGMRELHFWIYFYSDAQPDANGKYSMRIYLPNGAVLAEPALTGTGTWQEVVVPIDRWSAENEMSSFDRLLIIWLPGAPGSTGKFLMDELYGVRKGNTPAVKDILLYGFEKTNANDTYPLGWTVRAAEAAENGLRLGDAEVEASEGTNYMVSVLPGGWKRPLETINSLKDFTQWDKAIDLTVDVMMSSDFSTWHNLIMVTDSSAGGYKQYDIRAFGNKDTWKTISWQLDMAPYKNAISNPNGWFKISFVTQTGDTDTGSVYFDNMRIGVATTYVGGARSINPSYFTGGETFDVQLTLDAEGTAQDYEVIETIPTGWTTSAISDGGTFANGKITWKINLASGKKNISYKITAPAKPTADAAFAGTVGGVKITGIEKISYIYPKLMELAVEAKFLKNTVTLDGLINTAEYAGANSYTFGHDNTKDNTAPGVHISGTSYPDTKEFVKFYVQHDANFIYVACDVTDPNLAFAISTANAWQDDSMELYLDGNLSRSTPKEAGAYGPQMTVVGDGSIVSGQGLPTIVKGSGFASSTDGAYWNFGARAKADGSGYAVEYKLEKSKMLSPVTRDLAGFDIMVNSTEKGATDRTGKWGWYCSKIDGSVYEPWDDEAGWGLIKLLPETTSVSDWSIF